MRLVHHVCCLLGLIISRETLSLHNPTRLPKGRTILHRTHSLLRHSPTSSTRYPRSLAFSSRSSERNSRRKQVQWILQNLQKTHANETQLMDALQALASARTFDQWTQAGQWMETWWHASRNSSSVYLVERVARAAAMAGLHSLALDMVAFQDSPVSYLTQDAICSSLRRAGELELLQQTVQDLGSKAVAHQQAMSIVSFNIMLAALCDAATNTSAQRQSTTLIQGSRSDMLDLASQWLLRDINGTLQELGMEPNAVSYATVLNAAAQVGNVTLGDALWQVMRHRQLPPNTFAYNARLKLLARRGSSATTEMLKVWTIMSQDPHVRPDRYSLDLMLVPFVRTNQMDAIEALLDEFIEHNSKRLVSDVFAAFLTTLSKAGEVGAARHIFDVYMQPTLPTVLFGALSRPMRLVKPLTRHINVLLDGYQRKISSLLTASSTQESKVEELRQEAWKLYQLLGSSPGLQPDSFSYTTMMGICKSSHDLTNLLRTMDGPLSTTLTSKSDEFRAALTNFGRLGDISSLCYLFAHLAANDADLRAWNVFLGAMAKGGRVVNGARVNVNDSKLRELLPSSEPENLAVKEFLELVDGYSCPHIARHIMECVEGSRTLTHLKIPKPDSQFFCLMGSALHAGEFGSDCAMDLFRLGLSKGIPAEGRFVNAVLRNFGGDIKSALVAWKAEVRKACLVHEYRSRSSPASIQRCRGKNLIAAYHGLLYVAGRAGRPDVALRVVYAMRKEGLEPDETALNCFMSGRRDREQTSQEGQSAAASIAAKVVQILGNYESLLYVECMKYDQNDKRRDGEKRVRIILR